MPRIHLIRHGRAAAGWDDSLDPALDRIGRSQAAEVAAELGDGPPLAISTSPLLRCRQTAEPLAERWGVLPAIVEAVAEIPSPDGVAMGERVGWLRRAMTGTWADLDDRYRQFRDGVVHYVAALEEDTVVFSHFVAINAVIGAAESDDRVVIYSLDNCSVTTVEVDGGSIRLLAAGRQADTLIR